ncbi:TPA_asm: hypothetical protein GGB20_14205 [Listeria monocytogenes]|uniref:glycoside hydrolase domain-containing protein n=1 Tax=Listeria monocytogenes TaxID=1639 RepID=UPI00083CC42D|nr:glycoside hydrolase domain-containing protein [Listeria monocytogenes]EAD7195946.1 DUF1906 domain-containing protein [Listeria monocytogenes]EAH0225767.1 DUF1906 domain-containing protein [Listeria monocytogenes]EHG8307985.1 DUF1906 domain-containing protein [Listeria monocytogenes]ODD35804.1 hypothetical protein BB708_00145 [Listeria monocytogenes]ODE20901.1 hypothetical protein BB654_14935 [Listeria monocytogenes]
MAVDEQLLVVQQWLNKTYGKVSGYHHVKEDGKHTWETIYALITGLQHELGITDLATSFGPTTAKYFDQQGGIEPGDDNNKVKILMGGFWCKGAGFNPGGFDTYYEEELEACVIKFKAAAGLTDTSGRVDSQLMKAVLNMDAYTLLGDETIRTIQQALNKKYNAYFDLIACDGIYQRNTNSGLIYGLQAELGIDTETANGSFGPLTTTKYKAAAANDGINNYPGAIKILQYALYINTGEKVPFTGKLDASTIEVIKDFENFMAIRSSNSGYPTITIAKGLLQSSGDPDRDSDGVDTSAQLTSSQIQTLIDNSYTFVGRYLTGTVGGSTPKNLTVDEIDELTTANMHIFPIYQDNSPTVGYYTEAQGEADAKKACQTAFELGFEPNSILYYAVDVDTTDDEITSNILPYFKGVRAGTFIWQQDNYRYPFRVCIYASRNACTRVNEAGYSVASFVANMSTGYSGNLGFPQPKDWSFDQFAEPSDGIGTGSGNVPVDKVAVSGKDAASSTFRLEENLALIKMREWGSVLFGQAIQSYTDFKLGTEYVLYEELAYKFSLAIDVKTSGGTFEISGRIENGKIDSQLNQRILDLLGGDASITAEFTENMSKLTSTVTEGSISLSASISEEGTIAITAEIEDELVPVIGDKAVTLVYTFEYTFRNQFPDLDLAAYKKLSNENLELASLAIFVGLVFIFAPEVGTVGAVLARIATAIGI